MQRLLERGDGLLALLRLPLRDCQIINNLRCAWKSAPGFGEQFHCAIGVSQSAQKQLRQAQICPGMVWIDQQALLIIGRYLGEFRFGFVDAIRTLERTRFLVEHLSQ